MTKNRKKKCILIFEDDKDELSKLEIAFKKVLSKTSIPVYFFSTDKYSKEIFEERLKKDFKKNKYGEVALIVCDRDLSRLPNYPGLSAANVSNVANELVIPICLYAQGIYEDISEKIKRWSEFEIILDIGKGYENFAKDCIIIYNGFQEIESSYCKIRNAKRKRKPLPDVLSIILDKPYLKDRIALYGTGNKQMLAEILPYIKGSKRLEKENQRISRLLGYWLWNSLLRFPGVILNSIAAASFLNIDDNEFQTMKEVRKLFKEATYNGPFSDIQDFWWRDVLENILFKEKCGDGLQYVLKKLKKKLSYCKCFVDTQKRAGFYCMIEGKPVSDENSYSNINWFPAGADLARISKPRYDELAPWIALY